MSDNAYELNAPNVAAETIDDEAVVIHLGRGTYFSIRELGCVVWTLLLAGESEAAIAVRLSNQYPANAGVSSGGRPGVRRNAIG